jgi:thioredoxin reductase
VGNVDRFPELKENGETSVPGIYCVGDLTGVPLIKLATESGHEMIERWGGDSAFQEARKANIDPERLDLVIIGAGPSGLSAGLCAMEMGYRFVILESSRCFNTIENFPRGKPIYVSPRTPWKSALQFSDGTKESLLEQLGKGIEGKELPVQEGEMVKAIKEEKIGFAVESSKATYKTLRVIVAIGKTGNARMLNIPGEKLPKVFTRLIDPTDHQRQDILVVGGGDSALEAAVALAEVGNRVTLSYRKAELSRPKEQNLIAFNRLVQDGLITAAFETTPREILEKEVKLDTPEGLKTISNDAVFALIGTEIPIQFFRRSNIRMQGEMRTLDWVALVGLLLFSAALYFGKKAQATPIESFADFFSVPGRLLEMKWTYAVMGLLAWVSFVGMFFTGLYLLFHLITRFKAYFTGTWPLIKYTYYAAMFVFFMVLYYVNCLEAGGDRLFLGLAMGDWYTTFYAVTILVFGLRRMQVKPTGYIQRQTWTLIAFQWIPLFLLPVFVFPFLGKAGFLPDWVMTNVFPDGSYFRAYGLILAWPLFFFNLAADDPVSGPELRDHSLHRLQVGEGCLLRLGLLLRGAGRDPRG